MSRFVATASFLVLLLLLLPAAPALAHGVGAFESSNFSSRVMGLVDAASPDSGRGDAQAAVPDVEGLAWHVLGGDAYLTVTNRTQEDLVVLGYELEPYLRIGPNGVFANARSPSTYLNRERYVRDDPLPAEMDPAAEPQWVRVSDGSTYAWHDHRMQWMGGDLPVQVRRDPGSVHEITDWVVPFDHAGRALGVTGELVWVPPPSPWPWLGITRLALLVPVGIGVTRGSEAGRAAGATLVVVAVMTAVGTADEVASAVQASAGEIATTQVPAAVAVGLAGLGGIAAWRRWDTAPVALPVGAFALAAVAAYPDVDVLRSSHMLTSLPPWLVRVVVSAGLGVVAPALVGAYVLRREPAHVG